MDKIKDSVKKFFEDIKADFIAHKPTKKSFLKLAVLLLTAIVLFGVGVLTVNLSMLKVEKGSIVEAPSGDYDCVLILGCLVKGDTPSDMLKDRLDTGIRLYKSGAAPKILMTGDGRSDSYDEVSVMKAYAIAAGVPEKDIICDSLGLCTYDSMWRAENVYGIDSAIVITQEYHLTRALYNAEGVGMDACGVAADLDIYGKRFYRNTREIFARFKDFFLVFGEFEAEYTELAS